MTGYRHALTAREPPDLIIASFPYSSGMLVGPARRLGIPLVYDAHNAEADRFRHQGRLIAAAVQRSEAWMCRHASGVLAVSPDDRALLRQAYAIDPLLLPNGVNTGQFQPGAADPGLLERYRLTRCKRVLFFGALDYPPNAEALRFLIDQWPRVRQREPRARLLVVGRRPPSWLKACNGVIVTGPVDDIAAHIRLADVVAAPITSGGGTRLKIIEALACGRQVLATPFAALGIRAPRLAALRLSELDRYQETLLTLLASPARHSGDRTAAAFASAFDWTRLVTAIDWGALSGTVTDRAGTGA